MRNGFLPAFRGMAGLGGSNYSIATDAEIAPQFSAGKPGTYVIRMVVEGVRIASETRALHDVAPYNAALRGRGLDADVTKVRYVGSRDVRSSNWATDALPEWMGGTSVNETAIYDLLFDVTVNVRGQLASGGINGMGAVQIGAGAVFAIIGVVAIALAVTFPGFGKMVLESVKFIGSLVGATVGGAAGAVAENAIPILIAVGVAALAIKMLSKSGARFKSKGGGFSLGGS